MIRVDDKNYKLTPEEIEYWLDIYKYSDDVAMKDKAGMKLYCSVYKFIISILAKRYPTYYTRYQQDMINECSLCFFEKIKDYDPKKAGLMLYMKPHILHQIQNCVDGIEHNTSYYGQQEKKVRKCIKEFEATDTPWDAVKISEKTGIALYTVKKVLAKSENAEISYDTDEFQKNNIQSPYQTPEEQVVTDAERNSIYRAIKTLTPDENIVIRLYFGLGYDNTLSIPKIAVLLKKKPDQIKRIHTSGMRKITRSIEREGLFENRIIKKEINTYCQEISFLPQNTDILEQLASEEIEINF